MKKIIILTALIAALVLPYGVSAASVTTDTVPTTCSSAVLRGSASYTAPETLRISLNGSVVTTLTSGESSWQVTSSGPFRGSNTVTAEILDAGNAVIASASTSFGTICGNMDPMSVTQPWGLTGHQTPRVAKGGTVTDKYGFSDICPRWYPGSECFDISNTEYYLSQFIGLVLGR